MAFALNALKTHGCGFDLLCRPDVSLHLPFLVSFLSRFRVEDRNCDLDDFNTVFFKRTVSPSDTPASDNALGKLTPHSRCTIPSSVFTSA